MDKRLKQGVLIEEALKSQPLASMPRSITAEVMRRIQKDTRPVFFTWRDFVLSFVMATCIAALWFTSQNLPPILLTKIEIQSILLYENFLVNARWLIPALSFALAAVLSALTMATLLRMTVDRRR